LTSINSTLGTINNNLTSINNSLTAIKTDVELIANVKRKQGPPAPKLDNKKDPDLPIPKEADKRRGGLLAPSSSGETEATRHGAPVPADKARDSRFDPVNAENRAATAALRALIAEMNTQPRPEKITRPPRAIEAPKLASAKKQGDK
jgi:hypothetical protein